MRFSFLCQNQNGSSQNATNILTGQQDCLGEDCVDFDFDIKMRRLKLSILLCLFLPACIEGGFFTPKEPAMCPGMNIDVTRGSDRLKISAKGTKTRIYEIKGHTIEVDLGPRRNRWRGSLGLYRPGGKGNFHLVLDEGQQHFHSEKEAHDWIKFVGDRLGYMYSSDGLVVGWKLQKDPESDQNYALSVDLWQIVIQGKKPESFKGADDKTLKITRSSNACKEFKVASNFNPSSPQSLDGREYSGKVIDRMNEKWITPSRIEQTINHGKSYKDGEYMVYTYDENGFNFIRVKLDKSGKVVLLIG